MGWKKATVRTKLTDRKGDFMEKIFLDTDIGSDCDDAGALAILHHLAELGEAEILGCTHCGSEIGGAVTVKAINDWYGRETLPIGQFKKHPFLEEENCKRFTSKIAEEYLKTHTMPEFESATRTLRRALAENKEVVLVTIGMFNNIAELLRSQPDEISEKTGLELCRDSVKCMYSMGGNFENAEFKEYNIACDRESASFVAENFPKPINYVGFEIGSKIITGKNLTDAPDKCPLKAAYEVYNGLRESWDPITVYCAVRQKNEFFKYQENVKITFDEAGRTVIQEGGKDCYVLFRAGIAEIQDELEKYIRA